MDDAEVARLESLAQQFIARVHEDDPHALQRWLHSVTGPEEREALLYVLAAAVPTDRTWRQLTAWTRGESTPEEQAMRRRVLSQAMARPGGGMKVPGVSQQAERSTTSHPSGGVAA